LDDKQTNRFGFTHAALSKLPVPADKRTCYFDTRIPGFGVFCWPSGAKTFFLYRKVAGRPVRIKIGRFGDVTVDDARKEALALAGDIARGKNPVEEKRKAREESILADVWELYLEKHAKPRKRTWQEDERQWNVYLKSLKNRRLSEIHRAAVRDWHAGIGKKHGEYQANRALSLLSGLFSFIQGEGYPGANPCKGVRRFKENSRARFLAPDELAVFFRVILEQPAPWADFFRVLLLTGARISNVCSMRWADLELQRGLWRVPGKDSKTGDPLVIILVPEVVTILSKLAEENENRPEDERTHYVFPGRGRDHIGYPQAAWSRITEAAKLTDVRPHDLRRTLASWGVGAGGSLYAIGKALGHRDAATTSIYARLDLTPIRQAVAVAVNAILEAVSPPPPKKKKPPRAVGGGKRKKLPPPPAVDEQKYEVREDEQGG